MPEKCSQCSDLYPQVAQLIVNLLFDEENCLQPSLCSMPLVLAIPEPGILAVLKVFCDLRSARVAAARAASLFVLEPLASRPELSCLSWKAARRVSQCSWNDHQSSHLSNTLSCRAGLKFSRAAQHDHTLCLRVTAGLGHGHVKREKRFNRRNCMLGLLALFVFVEGDCL